MLITFVTIEQSCPLGNGRKDNCILIVNNSIKQNSLIIETNEYMMKKCGE